jgi:hypothetical protein
MIPKQPVTNGAADVTLAGSLLSSPVWASWLADFNELLTTLTLVIGVVLGIYRLWAFWVDRQKNSKSYNHDD